MLVAGKNSEFINIRAIEQVLIVNEHEHCRYTVMASVGQLLRPLASFPDRESAERWRDRLMELADFHSGRPYGYPAENMDEYGILHRRVPQEDWVPYAKCKMTIVPLRWCSTREEARQALEQHVLETGESIRGAWLQVRKNGI